MVQPHAHGDHDRDGERRGNVEVYVLDDHQLVRHALIETIDAADGLVVVGSSGTARDALVDIPRLQPDVALLDGVLPDGNGLDLCRTLTTTAPNVACIILTAATGLAWGPDAAAEAGAAAYLIKKLTNFPLTDTIRCVANRQPPR